VLENKTTLIKLTHRIFRFSASVKIAISPERLI